MIDPRTFVRSVTHGRARLRHASLKGLSTDEAKSIADMLEGFDGITSVELNPRVGSLLVTWDESKTNAQSLLDAAAFFLPEEEIVEDAASDVADGREEKPAANAKKACALCDASCGLAKKGADKVLDLLAPVVAPDAAKGGRTRRVTQNRLMLAAYAVSIASLGMKSMAVHLALGTAFTALLAVHLYQHRRVL